MQPQQSNDQFQPAQSVDQPVMPQMNEPQASAPTTPVNEFQIPAPATDPQSLAQPYQQASQAPFQPQVYGPQQSAGPAVGYSAPDLSAPTAPQPVNADVSAHKGDFLKHTAMAAVAIVAVAAILGGVYVGTGGLTRMSKNNAMNAAVSFIGDLNSGNNSKAYQAASHNFRNVQSESEFATAMGDLTAKNPKFQDQAMKVSGSTATYTATEEGLPATSTGRTDGIFTISLVKHGLTSWQVDSVHVD